jgi:seryl-tRNA synthetase
LIQLKKENANLKATVDHLEKDNDTLKEERDRFRDQVKEMTSNLGDKMNSITDRTLLTRMDALRADKAVAEKKVLNLLGEINTVTVTVSDLTMENKQLRKMANLPDNYGIDLNTIKLHDKEKIEDFKRLIKVLQDDNYKLEEERARLKHAVKTQAIVNHKSYTGSPYGELTEE